MVRKKLILLALLLFSINIVFADSLDSGDKICFNNGYCYTILTNTVYFTDLTDDGNTIIFIGLLNTTVINSTDDLLISSGTSNLTLSSPPHNVSLFFTSTAPYISLTFYYSAVNFGTLTHGTNDNPAFNQSNGIYNVTVDTIAKYKFSCNSTDLSDGLHTLDISNLKIDLNTSSINLSSSSAKNLSTSSVLIDTNIGSSNTVNYHGFWLNIPSFQYGGNYNSNVTMTYGLV